MNKNIGVILVYFFGLSIPIIKALLKKSYIIKSIKIEDLIIALAFAYTLVFDDWSMLLCPIVVMIFNVFFETYVEKNNKDISYRINTTNKVILTIIILSVFLLIILLKTNNEFFSLYFLENIDLSAKKILLYINVPISMIYIFIVLNKVHNIINSEIDTGRLKHNKPVKRLIIIVSLVLFFISLILVTIIKLNSLMIF